MSRQKIVRLTIRLGVILVIAFAGVEFLMIVTDPFLFKGRFESDPDMGVRLRSYYPNGVGRFGFGDDGTLTNRFGFNDQDYPLEKAPGTFRIVVVGDSFGWAGGVEGNYTALLEKMFATRDGAHRIEVINTGYPGTHTGEQLTMLKKFALQYNPDLVVLGFYAGNDFFEADPNRKRLVINKYFYDIDRHREVRLFGYPIIFRSRIWLFLKGNYEAKKNAESVRREADARALASGQPAGQPLATGTLPQETFYEVHRLLLQFNDKRTPAARFSANIKYIFDSINSMNELLKSRGIKFAVAIYPDEIQVNEDQFNSVLQRFNLNKDSYDLDRAQNLLRPFLTAQGIPYIDFLDRFRIEGKQRDLYLFHNTHWNGNGNQLAAQMLFEYLTQQAGAFNLPVSKPGSDQTSTSK